MRRVAVCLLILAALASGCHRFEYPPRVSGVLRLECDGGYGSCFIVGHDGGGQFVATAAHCVDGRAIVDVLAARSTDVVAVSLVHDTALLYCVGLDGFPAYTLRGDAARLGERCSAVGFPTHDRGFLVPRYMTGLACYPGHVTCERFGEAFLTNTGVYRGMSGGPLLDTGGNVIGIASSVLPWDGGAADSTCVFRPVHALRRMLNEARKVVR